MRIIPNSPVPPADGSEGAQDDSSETRPGDIAGDVVGDQAWSRTWTAGIGERLRAARLAAGLSTQQVADRTAELGYPMARASIGNLETRPRDKIYLQDIVVLAAALGVPPLEILYPLEINTASAAITTPAGVVRHGVLKNVSMPMLPGRTERAPAAAGWFTGGFGRTLEARLAAITAYGKFEARFTLLSMLNEESKAGALAARLEAAGAPAPAEILNVLWMEVYDLARWALDAIKTYDDLAARTGDARPGVTEKERALVEHGVSTRPPGYIENPAERPFVGGVLTIGAPEPGGSPYYLQEDPEGRWTPADLTRPATSYGTAGPEAARPDPAPRGRKPRSRLAWPSVEGPPPSVPEHHGPSL